MSNKIYIINEIYLLALDKYHDLKRNTIDTFIEFFISDPRPENIIFVFKILK